VGHTNNVEPKPSVERYVAHAERFKI
ncbi:uncharacterized protein METZ01_LOCUS130676, partial [marine metagenome]